MDDQDVITIMNCKRSSGFGCGAYEFWGPQGYVSGIFLAKEERAREIYPHLAKSDLSQAGPLFPIFRTQPATEVRESSLLSALAQTGSASNHAEPFRSIEMNKSDATKATTEITSRGTIVIDLSDSSDDEEPPDRDAASASSLSTLGDLEETHVTIPILEPSHPEYLENTPFDSDDEVEVIHHKKIDQTDKVPQPPMQAEDVPDFESTATDEEYEDDPEDSSDERSASKHGCALCNYVGGNPTKSVRHQKAAERLHKTGREFRCSMCKKSYCFKKAFQYHNCEGLTATDHKHYDCSHCDYRTDSYQNLQRHEGVGERNRTHGQWPVACPKCDQSSCTKNHKCTASREQHLNQEGGVDATPTDDDYEDEAKCSSLVRNKYGCTYCDYQGLPGNTRHQESADRLHSMGGSPEFKCDLCRRSFCFRKSLLAHICQTDSANETSGHRRSNAVDQNPSLRQQGVKHIENAGEPTIYQCGYCDYETDLLWLAERHQASADKQHQGGELSTWPCYDCKKVYCFNASLTSHQCSERTVQDEGCEGTHETRPSRQDSNHKNYACAYCDFTTTDYQSVRRHENSTQSHRSRGYRPIACGKCSKTYCTTRHICAGQPTARRSFISSSTDTEDEEFQVEDTADEEEARDEPGEFHQTNDIKKELRHFCRYCSYGSFLRIDVTRHEGHGETLQQQGKHPIRCEECDKTYCTRQAMK